MSRFEWKKIPWAAGRSPAKGAGGVLRKMARHWTWKVTLLLEPARRAAEALHTRLRA